MPAKKLTGPFVVINPRGRPKGKDYVRDVVGGKETGRWFTGDIYTGVYAESLLERGIIKPKRGK